ncbi:MAG: acyl carrier protein [Lachnospiraceae bacterium]|nr:acyl carrier protein [Lachnospiraceae bacterium]
MKMERLLEVLSECCPDVDFDVEKELITGKVIDSVDLVAVVSDIEDEFGISIPMEELVPENFDSIEAIWEMVQRLS